VKPDEAAAVSSMKGTRMIIRELFAVLKQAKYYMPLISAHSYT